FDSDPREAARNLAQMLPNERELFARGYADELAQTVLKSANTFGTLKRLFMTPTAQAKLEVALGRPRAREVEALLRAEAIAQKSQEALGNSTTARQHEMIRQFRQSGAAHGLGGFGAGAGAIGLAEFLHEGDFDVKDLIVGGLVLGAVRGASHKI